MDGMRVRKNRMIAAVAVATVGSLYWVAPAQADRGRVAPADVAVGSTVAAPSDSGSYSSTLTLTVDAASAPQARILVDGLARQTSAEGSAPIEAPFNEEFEAMAAAEENENASAPKDADGPSRAPDPGGGAPASGGEQIRCNKFYMKTDTNGTFTYQHKCGGNTAPWGYKITPTVQRIIVNNVSQRGMRWSLNGVAQRTMTGHNVEPGYHFHGTFKPVRDGDTVGYNDLITFECNVGPRCKGSITIRGAIKNIR
ncbi:hypothetical protein [Actinoplanes sp. NPDC049118]|uniref:hypothetical protein n=1 Tax=Actinoplanes sp. NPDC049118 TaxID=3155769 RepID=UPI0033EA2383